MNTRFIFRPSFDRYKFFYSFIYLSLSLSLLASRPIRNEITNVRYETTCPVFTFRPVATSRGFRVNWYNYFIDRGRSAQLLALIFISMRRETVRRRHWRERARRRKVKDTQPVVHEPIKSANFPARGEEGRTLFRFSLSLSLNFSPSKISVISREEKTRGVSTFR